MTGLVFKPDHGTSGRLFNLSGFPRPFGRTENSCLAEGLVG